MDWLKYECKKKSENLDIMKRDNTLLKNNAEQVIALYDITKDICRTLDVESMLNIFKDYAGKYIGPGDYRLVYSEDDLKSFPGYARLPLCIKKSTIGYLIAGNVLSAETDKFHILGQQLLIGIKRSYLYNKVQELAITDSLTQAYTRRYFLEKLNEEIVRCEKFKHCFAFLMVDIDHFKEHNDRYGHLVGDAILRETVKILKDSIRQVDFIGRYGGEELAIVLTETGKSPARIVAERIREYLSQKPVKLYDESLQITVSVGVSSYPEDGNRSKDLIEKADRALYAAKEQGRNRVCVSGD
jgi:diguanylate cyclase (GGDEF)-like protein